MTPAPQSGQWSIPYNDGSGTEFQVSYDAQKVGFDGELGLVTIEHVSEIDWPLDKIDWLVERLLAAKVAMKEVHTKKGQG